MQAISTQFNNMDESFYGILFQAVYGTTEYGYEQEETLCLRIRRLGNILEVRMTA